jgi:tetratricopeptide (TPR) repeat protein
MTKALATADAKPRWRIHFERALALCSEGESRAALGPLNAATRLNPSLTQGWRLSGNILAAGGDFRGARASYDRATISVIRESRLRAAAEALAENRLGEAERELGQMISHRSAASSDAKHLLGEVYFRQGRLGDAEAALRACLGEALDAHAAQRSLGQVLSAQRRFVEAVGVFDAVLARDADDYLSLAMKAAALTEIGRYAEAGEVSATMLGQFPDQSYAWLVHANGLRALGQTDPCIVAFGKAIELDPHCAEAYLSLANLKTYRFTREQVAAMRALLADADLPTHERVKLHFALGKDDEDASDYASAFGHYKEGNTLERSRRAHDPEVTSAYVRESQSLYTSAFFAARSGWGVGNADPIFIVGLPRSGSTLVEQILASHPDIEGTHELADLPILASSIKGYPQGVGRLTREDCARLGSEYLRRTSAYRNLKRPRFIDKTPKNFLHIGLIQIILPNARVVDVRRHPLACGLSIYKQHFGHGFASAFDLEHIGRYYADYVDLIAHVDGALPGRVHRVVYERLVADTEAEVRRLLTYLGLPFNPACLRFFENRRAVDTPSSEQVRQPIFTEGLDHWRNFEPWLDKLKAALGPALAAYPEAPGSARPAPGPT